MRSGKSLLILLVFAAGLGAYIYFVESQRDLTDPATIKPKVFQVEAAKIEEIEIRTPAAEVTTARKEGDVWKIVAPVSADADQSAIGTIATTLETMDIQRDLDENPASVAQYGLEPARASIAFKVSGETAPRRLLLGNKTPTGSDIYARVDGQSKLFLIASYLEDSLNRTTFDLRDKSVLRFARDDLDAISLGAVELVRDSNDWRLTAPLRARADAVAVDTAISRVADAQMKSLAPLSGAEPTPAELRKYGLDRPQFVATFGAKSNRASLAFGAKTGDTGVYARDLSRPLVFVVEPALLTDLQKEPEDFRVKNVFAFRSFSVREIEVTQAGLVTALVKSAGAVSDANPTGDVWKQTKPAAKDLNATAAADFLNTLSSLQADTFAAAAFPSGEDVVVVARFGEGPEAAEERVTFRRSGSTVQAIRPDDPGAAVVPTAEFEKALSQLKNLTGTK